MSLRASKSAMSSSDNLIPKPTYRIQYRTANYHTTKVIPHQKPKNGLSCQRVSAPHLTHNSWGPSDPKTQTTSRSVQTFLAHNRRVSLYFTMGCPSKLSLPIRGIWPHLIHGCLGPPKSTAQTTSLSVQPLFQGSLV